ncbi:MAG: HlyC/CorC family transporter [Chlorobi bacterium]|nr:HlyC/CorC family transporter [Chlorobiota bacterium]
MTYYLLFIFVSLVFSAFFSGMEIAFVSANRLKIEVDRKQKNTASRIISVFINNPGQFIATMLTGNNIALVVYGIFFAKAVKPLIERNISSNDFVVLLVQTAVSTVLILVTAEFLPKTIFKQNSNFFLTKFALPVYVFYILLYPAAFFSVWISSRFISVFTGKKIKSDKGKSSLKKIDLDYFLAESEAFDSTENETAGDVKIFKNALDFSEIKVRECMVPRNEIVAEDINAGIDAVKAKFTESGFSKIFIYKDNIDNIVGYVHTLAVFKQVKTIKSALQTMPIVPETMPANKLLNKLLKEHKSVALVVDEFGGTSGIVTMEDIIEEIFGDIKDEHDADLYIEDRINDKEYIFSARIEIDYLNEKYKFELPESEEFETLAGYIFFLHEQIPQKNDIIETEKYLFEVMEINGPKIEKVRMIIK